MPQRQDFQRIGLLVLRNEHSNARLVASYGIKSFSSDLNFPGPLYLMSTVTVFKSQATTEFSNDASDIHAVKSNSVSSFAASCAATIPGITIWRASYLTHLL